MNGNGRGASGRELTRCTILSCKFNKDGEGTVCDYAYTGSPCMYAAKRQEWHERGGLACFTHLDNGNGHDLAPEPARSLTARVAAAQRTGTGPVSSARARQLALALEAVSDE
jgi:hypothetical protein